MNIYIHLKGVETRALGPNRLSSALACKPPHPGLYAPASSSPLLFFHPGLGTAMWADIIYE
ncbi:hypothetical protein BpHYR1_009288 [Brachionus plicatilis]|uniref:Uncharacterized protein n=1 Tax=Brachionus plicatilis TaxID=10195 RepID=A0A3M7T2V8_BRAPC|nr:hypothetical protein BpHYR1_009288 [Brachionus plicatilis]